MRECPESREKRPLKMAALYKRLTFELIFNLAITRSFLRATFNVLHRVPYNKSLYEGEIDELVARIKRAKEDEA